MSKKTCKIFGVLVIFSVLVIFFALDLKILPKIILLNVKRPPIYAHFVFGWSIYLYLFVYIDFLYLLGDIPSTFLNTFVK